MNKIGILTHYHNSINFGGCLQAFALAKYLSLQNIEAYQICYAINSNKISLFRRLVRTCKRICKDFFVLFNFKYKRVIAKRRVGFEIFRDDIPHTDAVFSDDDLNKTNELFDAFIVGSDQVWHPSNFKVGYSLSFATKKCFAYSASLSIDRISNFTLENYKNALSKFSLISVREVTAKNILNFREDIIDTVDPVFLFEREYWKSLASENMVKEKYILTYFLGSSTSGREYALIYAKSTGTKIVNIPFSNGQFNSYDNNFGDVFVEVNSPNDFLSLIMNADLIFTDSFHAICFSYIFKKNFYVFSREENDTMSSRISCVLKLLNLENRYVKNNFVNFDNINYISLSNNLNLKINESKKFIKKIIDEVNNEK